MMMRYCIVFLGMLFATTGLCGNYASSYLAKDILDKIDSNEIKLIVEIGAFNCRDSVLLFEHYKCPVIAFECSPLSIIDCKKTIANYPAITLVEKAVWETTGKMNFNYCPPHPGSSSLYVFDYASIAEIGKNVPELSTVSKVEQTYPMISVEVEATRLDEWLEKNNILEVDMVCIDAQGATLPILKSMGSYLDKIKYIIAEVEYRPGYVNEPLFPEIKKFMEQNGFVCFNDVSYDKTAYFNDVLFVRKDLVK